MLYKYRPRYNFSFLIKITWTGSELKLTKLAPILNQLGIEDGGSLDQNLLYYYENLSWWDLEKPLNFFGRLTFIIWRRQAAHSLFFIKVFNLDGMLKRWLETEKKVKNLFELNASPKLFEQKFMFLSSLKWTPEYGYRDSLLNYWKYKNQFAGTFSTYSKREKMLGRKINFRRKVKKKRFDEY